MVRISASFSLDLRARARACVCVCAAAISGAYAACNVYLLHARNVMRVRFDIVFVCLLVFNSDNRHKSQKLDSLGDDGVAVSGLLVRVTK